MAAIAAVRRRICNLHPRSAMAIRTQAWPDGEHTQPPPTNHRFKGRTVREIIRYNEPSFDTQSLNLQNLRLLKQIFHLLGHRPRGLMEIKDLDTHQQKTVLDHPAIFNVIQSRFLCLTGEAQKLYLQEEALNGEEDPVRSLKKILMLAGKRRIMVRKIELLGVDLGLPYDLDGFLGRNEEFFKVSRTVDGTPWVSLGEWDPELAVSLGEIEDRRRKAGTMSQMEMYTPKGYILSKRHRKVLARFREAPFISPYAEYRDLEPLKMAFEKHAVAGMQELLNLTIHKSLLLSILTEFKTEFSFSHKPLDLLLRHPEYFYVSRAGNQETVFLRSAYRSDGELARRTPLVSIREQLIKLLNMNGDRAIKET